MSVEVIVTTTPWEPYEIQKPWDRPRVVIAQTTMILSVTVPCVLVEGQHRSPALLEAVLKNATDVCADEIEDFLRARRETNDLR